MKTAIEIDREQIKVLEEKLSKLVINKEEALDLLMLSSVILNAWKKLVESLNSNKDPLYKEYLEKLHQYLKSPLITSLISTQGKRTRKQSLEEAKIKKLITNHWEFMEGMFQMVIMDLLRQEEKLEQTLVLKGKYLGNHEYQQIDTVDDSIVAIDVLEESKDGLLELAMKQSLEISAVTEEAVLVMMKEEEKIEKEYNGEIAKVERQFAGNCSIKSKLIKKFNEEKEKAKSLSKKRIEEEKANKLEEISKKYNLLREKEIKTSESDLKLRRFIDSYSSLVKKLSTSNTSQANTQEPLS